MKSFCIIGLGKFGMTLAETLANDGKQVMIIDTDADKVNALADTVTNAIIGDPTNETVLRAAGVADYDCAVVGLISNVNDNILLTIMLKEMGIKKVVARASNDGHHKVLEKIGADIIVFPEKDTGEKLAYMLARDNVTDFADFHGYGIVEVHVPDSWAGKTLVDLEIRRKFGVTVLAVISQDDKAEVTPQPTRTFHKGERISVLGSDKAIAKFTKFIR